MSSEMPLCPKLEDRVLSPRSSPRLPYCVRVLQGKEGEDRRLCAKPGLLPMQMLVANCFHYAGASQDSKALPCALFLQRGLV